MDLYVSVIIPTYHDWNRLSLCIDALKQQTYPKNLTEIIIVNNDPEDKLPMEFLLPENCRLIEEPKPGPGAARNAGVNLATGDIFAFTDSDCIPDKNWISNAIDFLKDYPEIDRIGGKIELYYSNDKYTLAEAYETIFAFRQDQYVKNGAAATANMISRKKVFEEVGQFNEKVISAAGYRNARLRGYVERFNKGTIPEGGEDMEWGNRASQKGFNIAFSPDVVVKHPARKDLRQIIDKARRITKGSVFLHNDVSNKSNLTKYLHFIHKLRPPIKIVKYIFKKGKNLTTIQKIEVYFIRYYITIIRAYEKLKLLNNHRHYY